MAAQRVFIIGLFIWLGAILTGVNAQAYEASIYASVQTQTTPPRITINWLGSYNVTGYQIWRKLKGGTSWGSPVATLDASALSWVDNSVAVGVSYEYKIVRTSLNVGSGYSYINAGIELPMVESRGKVIVLVDDYFSSSLAPQLDQLVQDMEGDGWVVLRHDVSRSASVPSIKNIVVNDYNADPVNTKMVFLVGHVPVPYSGNMAADGHWEHLGAWSADVFYADVNGTWTDNQVNATGAVDPRNHNVPGDGKYDQSNIPSTVELAVGRVDFYDLPVFSESETTLMGNYLTKLHNWKSGALSPPIRALVDDNFQGYNAAFASNAYRGFSPLVGSVNVQDLDYFSTLPNQSYLWSYACGGGNWDNALGVGSSSDFATKSVRSIFNILFGSSFGDYDSHNNFMRSSLGSGTVLTCFWAGYPNWFFHHMGLGETIGFSTKLTQNNGNGHYAPANPEAGKVHIALLGDPTLRMSMVRPPSNVQGAINGSTVDLTWTVSPDNVLGYHVYRYVPATQSWQRVTTSAVTGTSYVDNVAGAGGTIRYMVRALKLQQGASGSYYNLSIGAFGQAEGSSQIPDCLGVLGGSALVGSSCSDGNDCTVNDVWNASCECQGTYLDSDGDGICDALDNCPGVPGQVGSSCNDGDPCTVNDMLDENCQCVGTFLDSDGDGICNAQDNCPYTPGQIGSPCDDGDPCTVNDIVNADCQCAGTYQDSDADGTCDALDDCPLVPGMIGSACDDGDPCTVDDVLNSDCQCAGTQLQDSDGDGICDLLDACPTVYGEPGWSCDDGDPCTEADVLDSDCNCVGTYVGDGDNDGICDTLDDCPLVPGTVGSPCDDGDPCTDDDVLNADCQCAGTLLDSDGDGICDSLDACPTVYGEPGWSCDDGDPCTEADVLDGDCNCVGTYVGDSDNDGICDTLDDCPLVPGTVGSPCDDGDPCTDDDVLNADCVCLGTYLDSDGDGVCDADDGCPYDPNKLEPGNCGCGAPEPGEACDDGMAWTINDTVDENCQCSGTVLDCLGVPNGTALPGTPCDDGDLGTEGDTWGTDCSCAGTITDCMGELGGTALPGTPCDDGIAATGNDTWTASCECMGELIDCEGIPGGLALPGTICNDGNNATMEDAWTEDCECIGLLVDCEGVPGGDVLPGMPCNDYNPLTTNDTWSVECDCLGDPADCLGEIGGTALPGTPCDDGDPNTGDDRWTSSCTCEGGLLDCLDLPGGEALPGTPCDDQDPNTDDDIWTVDCECIGSNIDCEGVAGGNALPGMPCDDGNPFTGSDSWQDNCECMGLPYDCTGVAGGPAMSGTPCDDGDISTGNDMWSDDCSCVGVSYDCLFQPGGTALPGTPCNDGNPTTGNDTWSISCVCVGIPIDCAGTIGGTAFVDDCEHCAGGTTGIIPDPDSDLDGVLDCLDNCPEALNPLQEDGDHDGVGDACDNCPEVYNPDQADSNGNGIGDACSESAIAEVLRLPGLSLSPNPTGGVLLLSDVEPEAWTVDVHDLSGARVFTTRFTAQLDVSTIASGAYILVIRNVAGVPLARAPFIRK
ncbi:MAG: thrombospondin type 3 repeat-containing protein [Flavobacteriales bacterium]